MQTTKAPEAELQSVQLLSDATVAAIQRLYGNAQQSIKAIEWLADQGFEPHSIHIGRSVKPLIRIEGCSLCLKLKRVYGAYLYMMRPGLRGRETVWRAVIYGCLVEWAEVSHA